MLSLTATELPRFIQCNGNIALDKISNFNIDTEERDLGNTAHWLVETAYKNGVQLEEMIGEKSPQGIVVDVEMVEHCEEYFNNLAGSIEFDTSHGSVDYEVRGRCDHIFFNDSNNTLVVDDFKYGRRIVEPDENWTLISHALGCMWGSEFVLNNTREIVFRIFQPRAYHPEGTVRTWRVSKETLEQYFRQMQAALANPDQTVNTGPNCYMCPSQSNCSASQIDLMNQTEISQHAFNNKLDAKDVSSMYDLLKKAEKRIKSGLKAYEDVMLHGLKVGKSFPNYSVKKDFTSPKWNEGLTKDILEMATGKDLSGGKMVTPKQAEKLGVSKEAIKKLSKPVERGLKLVRISEQDKFSNMFGDK